MPIWVRVCVCLLVYVSIHAAVFAVGAFKCKAPIYKYSNVSSYFNQAARRLENSLSPIPSVPFTQANSFTENELIEKPL